MKEMAGFMGWTELFVSFLGAASAKGGAIECVGIVEGERTFWGLTTLFVKAGVCVAVPWNAS